MPLRFKNNTNLNLEIAIAYYNEKCTGSKWRKQGWWQIPSNREITALSENVNNKKFFYFARSTNNAYIWNGDMTTYLPNEVFSRCWDETGGTIYGMRNFIATADDFTLPFSLNNPSGTDSTSSQNCSITGGKGNKIESNKIGINNILDLEYIIYECAIEVKPRIANINTGGTYTLSATQKGINLIWPIIPEVSRYVFSVYVENKTLWVELEMQHRTVHGFPPEFVWRKTWGTKTKIGSWASLKF